MSLKAFQQALVDLTLAPNSARAVRRGDTAVFDKFDLTPRERDRLTAAVNQPGMWVSCSLARGNRFEVIAETFPMTCVILEPVLRQLVDELWINSQPTNYQLKGEDTAFAAFLTTKRAAGEYDLEYLDEIFAYEQACRELTHGQAEQISVNFQHSPDHLLPPLSQLTAPPKGLPQGKYKAKIELRDGRFTVEPVNNLSALEHF